MPSRRRLRFTPDADADFESSVHDTARFRGEDHVDTYAGIIFDVLGELATFPGIGKPRDDRSPGVLNYPAGQHVIFFEASDDELVVYRIIHGRRDLAPEFTRRPG
jgi:toxin ParE1/3/4